ncbi:MAG TPA: GDP-mannose 4,6-dehydratase [Bacteroidia bacterium]|nr:GDP-mannose 4,6-dehydratase [Bacteroidia bacterium]HNU33469.1 GDP-mannose 4,6-dehydratase [Bacteroidia bacterium]
MKKILVTGGAGFIGSTLVEKLLNENNWEVYCLDCFDTFYDPHIKRKNISSSLLNKNFRLLEGDIRDNAFLEKIFVTKFDAVVHIAARAGVRPSIENPLLYEDVNVKGTINLLEKAKEHNIKQFVFASSSSVYGVNPRTPWSEDDYVLNPISPYAATKVSCELIGHTYAHLYNIRFIALRFFTVFGPRQRPDLAIHKFFKLIDNGKPIPFFGDGSTSRDYTFVQDIVQGIRNAIDYDKSLFEVVNLGNSRTVTLLELISAIEASVGKKAILDKLPNQPGDVPITFANVSKAKKLLDYSPSTSLNEGLEEFKSWYFANN